jgi:hypothetical protein
MAAGSLNQRTIALASLLGVGLVGALVYVAGRSSDRTPPVVSAPSASATATTPPSAPPAPPPPKFVFDCQSFGSVERPACGKPPDAGRELVEASRWPGVTAAHCGPGLQGEEAAKRAERAVARARTLDPKPLSALERALLQNAALKLLACSDVITPKKRAETVATGARGLIEKLALAPDEIAALPGSTPQLRAWLGDPAAWLRAGPGTTRVHESTDGFARAYQALQKDDTLANVARLALVDSSGAPRIADVVGRVLMRRRVKDEVRVCIVELDLESARCGAPGALSPLPAAAGESALKSPGAPPCTACHHANSTRSGKFGPARGAGIDADDAERVPGELRALLSP